MVHGHAPASTAPCFWGTDSAFVPLFRALWGSKFLVSCLDIVEDGSYGAEGCLFPANPLHHFDPALNLSDFMAGLLPAHPC